MLRSTPGMRTKLLLGALAALVTAAGAAGLGTMAAGYTGSSPSSGLGVTTGVVTIGAGSANSLTTTVSNLQPGGTSYRVIDLTASSTLLSSVTLSTTDTYSNAKLSTSSVGLQMTVQWCATAWTPVVTTPPALTYSCSGGATTLVPARDVITSTPLSLGSGLSAVNAGSSLPTTDHLRIALSLPTTSPSAAQSAQSVINYTFTGVQLTPPKKAR